MTEVKLQFGLGKDGKEFSVTQKSYLKNVVEILELALNTEDFRKEVTKYSFKTKIGIRRYYFRMNKGYSRKEIFELIMAGRDIFEIEEDTIDLLISPYKKEKKYHAYTKPSIKEIYLNTTYLDYCVDHSNRIKALSRVANTLLHEYIHNLGFGHKTNKPSDYNDTTVPYAVGTIIKMIIRKKNTK